MRYIQCMLIFAFITEENLGCGDTEGMSITLIHEKLVNKFIP